jgi:phage terminase large subunit
MTMTISPQPKQREFMRAQNRFVCYGGARGGGKSWAVRAKATLLCAVNQGIRVLIMRRTYQELRENHISILRRELRAAARYRDNEKTLTFYNGSVIRFGYCDSENDVDQYQGQEYDVIFLDEATHFSEYQFRVMGACVRGVNSFPKRMYLTCNPGGVGHAWVKRLFIDKQYRENERAEDYLFISAKVFDNPAMIKSNPGYLKFLDDLDPARRAAWRDGDWDVYEGQFFTEWDRGIHVCEPFEIPQHWRRYVTMDYGMDMLAAYVIAVSDTGEAYVIAEEYEGRDLGDGHDGLIISEAAERLLQMTRRMDIYAWLAPPDLWNARQETGRSVANLFAERGIHLIKTSNDRVDGWMATREWLKLTTGADGKRTARLKIFQNCLNLIRTLPLLMYDPKRASDAAKEPHEITHAPDALRGFCVYWVQKAKAPKTEARVQWTKDMWQDYNNADTAGRQYLKKKWGNPS